MSKDSHVMMYVKRVEIALLIIFFLEAKTWVIYWLANACSMVIVLLNMNWMLLEL